MKTFLIYELVNAPSLFFQLLLVKQAIDKETNSQINNFMEVAVWQ